ncbi:MAG: polymer-forming cytoskeletal protein [Treponema sp.]|nr:polymer-forming cytoskeletal protein [Candidatus Treponema equifaecale]
MIEVKDTDLFDLEEEDFDTILAPDIAFHGNIKFAKPFMIRGTVDGSIDATSDLVVDSDAVVKAGISASRVLVRGKVEGNIAAKDLVFVTASGSVLGDITSKQVVLEPGSHFTGRCTMTN